MTINIIWNHRNRVGDDGQAPVEIRVSYENKKAYITTGVKCRKTEFNGGEIINRSDAGTLNAILKAAMDKVGEVAAKMIAEGRGVEPKEIKKAVFASGNVPARSKAMLSWFDSQIPKLGLKPGTMKHYATLMTRLQEFGGLTAWEDLAVENIYRFDEWLHKTLRKRKIGVEDAKEAISDGGVYTYHKCLKALLNRALLFGKIQANPYERLKGKFKRGDKATVDFLTSEEMEAVEAVHPLAGSKMAAARDLFVFQMHTGMSYGDTQIFDFTRYRMVDGHFIDIGERIKTGVKYITQLDDACLDIIQRYGMKLPKLGNSDYNFCLKAIGVAAGLSKTLHSHMARHTFATQMLAAGAKIENVSKMLGHTNVTQTQRYAEVLPKSVLEDFDKMRNKKEGR